MENNIFEEFLNSLNPEENKVYNEWMHKVADNIARIIADLDKEDTMDLALYHFFMNSKYNLDVFEKYDNEIYKQFKLNADVESAAYRILDLIKKEMKI